MKRIVKKGDIVVILCVIIVAAIAFACINAFSSGGNYVEIMVDGIVVSEFDISNDTRYDIVKDSKVTNTVVIENSTVHIENASCPEKICQKHRSISKTGESIVCLPNKVIVSIRGNDTEIDGVA